MGRCKTRLERHILAVKSGPGLSVRGDTSTGGARRLATAHSVIWRAEEGLEARSSDASLTGSLRVYDIQWHPTLALICAGVWLHGDGIPARTIAEARDSRGAKDAETKRVEVSLMALEPGTRPYLTVQ